MGSTGIIIAIVVIILIVIIAVFVAVRWQRTGGNKYESCKTLEDNQLLWSKQVSFINLYLSWDGNGADSSRSFVVNNSNIITSNYGKYYQKSSQLFSGLFKDNVSLMFLTFKDIADSNDPTTNINRWYSNGKSIVIAVVKDNPAINGEELTKLILRYIATFVAMAIAYHNKEYDKALKAYNEQLDIASQISGIIYRAV